MDNIITGKFAGKFAGIKNQIKEKVNSTIKDNSITSLIALAVIGALVFGIFT